FRSAGFLHHEGTKDTKGGMEGERPASRTHRALRNALSASPEGGGWLVRASPSKGRHVRPAQIVEGETPASHALRIAQVVEGGRPREPCPANCAVQCGICGLRISMGKRLV
ncbi:MAG: hypothetical protein KAI66_01285, partial [Lentisphaeria bacterium]|nr:hypothetical protein [Lentisphaeria bacterium]